MKKHFFILFLVSLCVHAIPLTAATSISQYGITWTFDKDYPTGQFINGDWWVVGPVTVASVSPAPSQAITVKIVE